MSILSCQQNQERVATRRTKELDKNTLLKENVNKTKEAKKVTKTIRKQLTKKKRDEEDKFNKFESKLDEQQMPKKQTEFERDDDFWNFYEQPFVQSQNTCNLGQ